MSAHLRTVAVLLLAAASGAAMAQPAAADPGQRLFMQSVPACAVCHTLAAAGATGAVGPVLDELRPDAARVEKAIRNGIGQMPAYRNLSDADMQALARYVARATGAGR